MNIGRFQIGIYTQVWFMICIDKITYIVTYVTYVNDNSLVPYGIVHTEHKMSVNDKCA